jgi:hypothetical protein
VDSQEWHQRYAGTELVWTAEPNRFVVAELQEELAEELFVGIATEFAAHRLLWCFR